MEINEIKKGLYREKPKAAIVDVKKTGILYITQIIGDVAFDNGVKKYIQVYFSVPLNDIGEAVFLNEMPAQLLIRYLIPGDPAF